jgi:flagellar P-ring protein precursor FlgI
VVDTLNVKARTILMATMMNRLSKLKKYALVMLCMSAITTQCFADRIKDFADIAGQRSNQLVGYGLVVGLDGTRRTERPTAIAVYTICSYLVSHICYLLPTKLVF